MRIGVVTTQHKWLNLDDAKVALYNLHDCQATAKLTPIIKAQLERSGNLKFFEESFWPMVEVTTAMQARGVGNLDREARNAMRAQLRAEIRELEKSILEGVSGTYDEKLFNSPKQLARLLYDEWGLPSPPASRKRPARSTDLDSLAWVLGKLRKRDEAVRVRLHDLFHRSRLQTILERYLSIEGDEDGRVRPTIKLTGTETLRLAYAGGPGEALQQWPSEVRHLIRAAPGKVFISRDYSQLEARILAVLAEDQISLKAFAEGRDIHTQNALDLFGTYRVGKLDSKGRAPGALRNYAKTFLYGISYGGQADSLKMKVFCPCFRCVEKAPEQVNLDRREVKRAADRWAEAHASVLRWREDLVEGVFGYGKDRTWTSPFGFRRRFWEPRGEGERSLMNLPMQHCLPAETRILTRAGWTPIGEFSSGEVWTGAEWAQAKRLEMGIRPIVEVRLTDGRTFRCDQSHQLLMRNGAWPEFAKVGEDECAPLALDSFQDWGQALDTSDSWYWAGRLMGDGWVRANGYWGIVFNLKERSAAEEFCRWLDQQQLTNKTHKWKRGYHVEEAKSTVRVVLASQDSHRIWRKWGFWPGMKARTKRVPPIVFTLDRERRLQFLLGWYDADGSKTQRGGGVTFGCRTLYKLVSVSKEACEDAVHLARTVGFRANFPGNLITKPNHKGWYAVFFLKRDEPVKVKEVVSLGEEAKTFTLSVDHPRHAYSSEGLISKNCASQIVNRAMVRLHELGAPIVLQMHDELVLEVEEAKADLAVEQLRTIMEMPVPELGGTVFPTKGGMSETWGGLK